MLVDLVPEQIPWLFSGVVVRKDDIAARRDLLTRFLKASIEGNYIALTDEKRAKEVLAKELEITSAKILDIAYNDFKQQSPQQSRTVGGAAQHPEAVPQCQPEDRRYHHHASSRRWLRDAMAPSPR